MTLSYTPRFHLAVPDFLSEPWHAEFAAAMESIDQALFTAIVAQDTRPWEHDHAYEVGDLIIDPLTGTLYSCAVAHLSSGVAFAPTFAHELAAHPTYWTSFAVIAASQLEAEQGIDNTKYMTPLRTAQAIFVQSPTPGVATVAQAQEGTNNTEIMTPVRVHEGITARIASQTQATAGTDNTVLMTPLRTEQLIVSAGVAGGDAVGFSAHKGGTNQAGIASGVATKVTFGTELYDSGSFYDTANSRWTPPSGQIHIDAAVASTRSVATGADETLAIYKNGVVFKIAKSYNELANAGLTGVQISIDDIANGTDYYEVFYSYSNSAPAAIDGLATRSYFMGAFLGEVGVVTMGLAEVGFRASKGGTAQPGFPNSTWTKISFGTEEYDQGSRYDPAISRWIPPTGLVHISAGMDATGAIAVGGQVAIAIYKNGAILKNSIGTASSGSLCGAMVSVDDIGSGVDYYEVFAYIQTGGATSIDGSAAQTFFTGHRITGAQGETGPIGLTGPSGSTAAPAISAGRLRFVNATTLSFLPFNGGHVKVNGVLVPIPTSGAVGLTNTNAYVNGVASQALAANTTYYVYVFVNAGVLTGEFSATGHATSVALTNEGTEIKSGDNTRTLVGMIRTSGTAGVQFVDTVANRLVLSWFNRLHKSLRGPETAQYTFSGGWVEINSANRVNFLTWGEESFHGSLVGRAYPYDTPLTVYGGVGLDGAVSSVLTLGTQSVQWWHNLSVSGILDATEGFHYLTPFAYAYGYYQYNALLVQGEVYG